MTSSAFTSNPLRTRADVQRCVHDLVTPIVPHFSPGAAQVNLGEIRAHYGDPAGLLEGFARPLWGLVPLAAGGGAFEHWELWRRGIAAGTDPDHPEFWGWPGDFDQRSVEAAAFGVGLALAPSQLWDPLPADVRQRFAAWLDRLNHVKLVDSNWLFFRVLVNLGLEERGQTASRAQIEADLNRLDAFYLGDGWYADGESGEPWRNGRTGDYYVPMAFHFYSLIYARVAGASDPSRAARYVERARLFTEDFIHWFSADGSALPFGRSLTYRFAQGAFWGGLAFAPVQALPWPVVKGLYLRHLRWWLRQPIFSETGLLTIGYAYPNLLMAESYNSSGSPYWALKTFLPLALPESHPFWQAEEAPLPPRRRVRTVNGAKLILTTDPHSRDITALNPGQPVEDWPRHAPQKYSKFAYSARFGFTVPASSATPQEGGFDSMLALSDDQRRFRVREHCHETTVNDGVAFSRWTPWPQVEVSTWLIAADVGHIRVHRVRSDRPLRSVECGFAAPYHVRSSPQRRTSVVDAEVITDAGRTLLRNLFSERKAECVDVGANSHLLASLSSMPSLVGEHAAGEFWLACFAGGAAPDVDLAPQSAEWEVSVRGNEISVTRTGRPWWRWTAAGAASSSERQSALAAQV